MLSRSSVQRWSAPTPASGSTSRAPVPSGPSGGLEGHWISPIPYPPNPLGDHLEPVKRRPQLARPTYDSPVGQRRHPRQRGDEGLPVGKPCPSTSNSPTITRPLRAAATAAPNSSPNLTRSGLDEQA